MTDFESKGSHEGRGFQALNAKSTWSSFEDIPWEDFGCEDHGVPPPASEKSSPSLWLQDKRKESSGLEMKEESSPMDADNWDPAELVAIPENLIAENGSNGDGLKQDSPDALLAATVGLCMGEQMYNKDVAGQFSFSDAPNEEEMRLFGSENDVDKGGTLLEYTWDGLEDMDKLFQNEESAFGEDAAEALLQWTSSSSTPDSTVVKTTELHAMKGKSDDEAKMEFIPCDSYEKSSEACVSDSGTNKPSDDHQDLEPTKLQTDAGGQISEEANSRKKLLVEDTIQRPTLTTQNVKEQQKALHCNVDKAHLMKRQTSRKDRSKRHLYPKKPGQNLNFKPVTHFHSSQPLQLASTLQVYPQVIGATLTPSLVSPTLQPRPQFRHSSAASVRPSPYVVQSGQALQHSQPVMMCYEPSEQQQHYNQQGRQKLDILTPPPVSGTNMTPQEKIEKLRWKQKMHRLASEQQQQITKQCMAADPYAVQKQGKLQLQGKHPALDTGISVHAANIKTEEGEGAVEDAVLNQLLSVMSRLDVGTRIHIRDAFYRLARNAMNRHAADGASSTTIPTCEKNTVRTFSFASQGALETETNPIDRTIVNLLFHRGQESTDMSSGNLTESEGSSRKPKSSEMPRCEASTSK